MPKKRVPIGNLTAAAVNDTPKDDIAAAILTDFAIVSVEDSE